MKEYEGFYMSKRTINSLCSQFELWDFLDDIENGVSLSIEDQRRVVRTALGALGEGETDEGAVDYDPE